MFIKKKRGRINIIVQIMSLLLVFSLITAVIVSMPSFRRSGGRIRAESIEQTIKKYAIQCYASEGSYPPDLEYLIQNYGLIMDKEHYFYFYDAFAANIMPKINVYSKGGPLRD